MNKKPISSLISMEFTSKKLDLASIRDIIKIPATVNGVPVDLSTAKALRACGINFELPTRTDVLYVPRRVHSPTGSDDQSDDESDDEDEDDDDEGDDGMGAGQLIAATEQDIAQRHLGPPSAKRSRRSSDPPPQYRDYPDAELDRDMESGASVSPPSSAADVDVSNRSSVMNDSKHRRRGRPKNPREKVDGSESLKRVYRTTKDSRQKRSAQNAPARRADPAPKAAVPDSTGMRRSARVRDDSTGDQEDGTDFEVRKADCPEFIGGVCEEDERDAELLCSPEDFEDVSHDEVLCLSTAATERGVLIDNVFRRIRDAKSSSSSSSSDGLSKVLSVFENFENITPEEGLELHEISALFEMVLSKNKAMTMSSVLRGMPKKITSAQLIVNYHRLKKRFNHFNTAVAVTKLRKFIADVISDEEAKKHGPRCANCNFRLRTTYKLRYDGTVLCRCCLYYKKLSSEHVDRPVANKFPIKDDSNIPVYLPYMRTGFTNYYVPGDVVPSFKKFANFEGMDAEMAALFVDGTTYLPSRYYVFQSSIMLTIGGVAVEEMLVDKSNDSCAVHGFKIMKISDELKPGQLVTRLLHPRPFVFIGETQIGSEKDGTKFEARIDPDLIKRFCFPEKWISHNGSPGVCWQARTFRNTMVQNRSFVTDTTRLIEWVSSDSDETGNTNSSSADKSGDTKNHLFSHLVANELKQDIAIDDLAKKFGVSNRELLSFIEEHKYKIGILTQQSTRKPRKRQRRGGNNANGTAQSQKDQGTNNGGDMDESTMESAHSTEQGNESTEDDKQLISQFFPWLCV